MAKVEYVGDEIVVDNTELLTKRADVNVISFDPGEEKVEGFVGDKSGLGGIMEEGGEEEEKLRRDLKRTGWHEASHVTEVSHVCPICGTRFRGRRNRIYCSPKCKEVGKKRKQRAKMYEIRDFKPKRGTAGQVYFMTEIEGKDVIAFVPAFHADSRVRAKKYIEENYPKEKVDDYIQQVNMVIKK